MSVLRIREQRIGERAGGLPDMTGGISVVPVSLILGHPDNSQARATLSFGSSWFIGALSENYGNDSHTTALVSTQQIGASFAV